MNVDIGGPDALRRCQHQRAVARLAPSQLIFGVDAVTDVVRHLNQSDPSSARVETGHESRLGVPPAIARQAAHRVTAADRLEHSRQSMLPAIPLRDWTAPNRSSAERRPPCQGATDTAQTCAGGQREPAGPVELKQDDGSGFDRRPTGAANCRQSPTRRGLAQRRGRPGSGADATKRAHPQSPFSRLPSNLRRTFCARHRKVRVRRI